MAGCLCADTSVVVFSSCCQLCVAEETVLNNNKWGVVKVGQQEILTRSLIEKISKNY